jgi:hypothetical protein
MRGGMGEGGRGCATFGMKRAGLFFLWGDTGEPGDDGEEARLDRRREGDMGEPR